MEERTQEYYMCGGDLHAMPPLWKGCVASDQRTFWQRKRLTEDTTTALENENAHLRAELERYKDWRVAYTVGIDDKILGLQEAVARQQEETEKWHQLYSVSRHQASRALDMLNSAKVQIEVLENKLNGRQ